ncbi:MAG: tetratricopeptide repeat protein [Cyanobacteria bacterium P01_G01_bin.54]
MAARIGLSESGRAEVEKRRKVKSWRAQEAAWFGLANTSKATLKRFRAGGPVEHEVFIGLCDAVGITDWQSVAQLDEPIVEFEDKPLDQPQPETPLIYNEGLQQIPVWRGRDAVLTRLAAQLQKAGTPGVLAIVGQGGIGKTSLAVKLLEAVQASFERVVFFKCQAGTGFDELVGFLLTDGLDIENVKEFKMPEQQIAAVVRGLGQRRCLLVVDNLESVLEPGTHRATSVELGRLLHGLVYQRHGSRLVLTSREVPADLGELRGQKWRLNPKRVQLERLPGIDDADAVAILREEYGFTDSDDDLKWIAERVKGHPLVLELLGSEYAEMPGYLRQHPELVTDEAAVVVRQQLARRDEAERELLARMAVLRVPIGVEGLTFLRCYQEDNFRFEVATIIEEPAELKTEETKETQTLVDRLLQSSSARRQYDKERAECFYDLHPLIKEVVQQEFSDELPELMQRAYKFYCTGKNLDNPKTLEDLHPVLEAQYFAFQTVNYDEAFNLLNNQIYEYLYPWGKWSLLEELYKRITPKLSDNIDLRICNQSLGILERDRGNWDNAFEYFQNSLKLAKEAESKTGMATSWGLLGDIERNRGNWDAAERLYRQSLELLEELGDRSGMATSWGQLGNIERNRGNWDAAERLYRQSLELLEELGDRSGMATSWGVLGDIENCRGNWDAAERLYRQSLELTEELGDQDGIARSTGSLGEVALGRGELDEAEKLLTDARQRFQNLGNVQLIAECEFRLAQLHQKRHNPTLAQTHYTTAHQLYSQLGAAKDLERIEREWQELREQ